ncbi:VRR-NUC domain-containing protein [bacterium]|nr:VRR-NUC domain-containing protein [bacterium]
MNLFKLKSKQRREQPERLIQNSVIEYLQVLQNQGKLFFWRQSNTGTYDKNRETFLKRKKLGERNGVPDILLCVGGRLVGFEVKAPKGYQSTFQKQFEADLVKAGGCYYIIKSLDDARLALARHGVS